MNKYSTVVKDCFWIQPTIFQDHRGVFSEIYKSSKSDNSFKPVQTNYSSSKKGTLRGIHRTPYAKYVTCIKGSVYDVCVDLRPTSKTYKKHFGIELKADQLNSLYIPDFCGHAFLALEDCTLIYQQDHEYNAKLDQTYCYKNFNIDWPMEPTIISDKDYNICK